MSEGKAAAKNMPNGVYIKREGIKSHFPDKIRVVRFSEYQLEQGGLSHVKISELPKKEGGVRMIMVHHGHTTGEMPIEKGDLVADGKGGGDGFRHTWIITDVVLDRLYIRFNPQQDK